jgi:hypothetical protein
MIVFHLCHTCQGQDRIQYLPAQSSMEKMSHKHAKRDVTMA